MDTRVQNQAKAPLPSSVSPVQKGLFQRRELPNPTQDTDETLHSSHQSANLQAQLERASRFGHHFSRVQVQGNTPPVIQSHLDIRRSEEEQCDREGNGVTESSEFLAPPLGQPIQREPQDEEPIQMMPQMGFLSPLIQRESQEDESVQMMPQMGFLSPLIQRESQDEEPIQMMPQMGFLSPLIQRESQEDEPIQMMPHWGMLQRLPQEDDEAPIQTSLERGVIRRQESEAEDEPLQMQQVQPKLVIGAPGDKYEQEADAMAAQVMTMRIPSAQPEPIQRQSEEDNEPSVQTLPLADAITPLVQRQTEEQEEAIQPKSLLQRAGAKENAEAVTNLEGKLSSSKGGGSPLPNEVRSFMEPRFGVDFSQVRVHTDSTAVQMNKELRAQAFTHGNTIYYGAGKSPGRDELTAHELTHVVQQTGAKTLQKKPFTHFYSNKETLQAKITPTIQLKKSPTSPEEDPAFQDVVKRTERVGREQKTHPPAKTKANEAQAAAKPPTNEVESKAQDKQVQVMNQQQPGQFNAAAFKAALLNKIAAVTPQTLEEADEFKDSNKLDSVKGDLSSQVTDQKKQASGSIEEKTKQPPNPSGITPKPVSPLPPKQAGAKPGDVGAAGAAPKPKDNSEVSLQEGSKSLDQQMAEASVSEEQLQNSNEPEFQSALTAKKTAQTDANTAPQAYRQQEQGVLNQAKTQAQTTASSELQGMHGSKEQVLAKVLGAQSESKGKDEQKRTEVANRVQQIYNTTKQKVETTLGQLDTEVNKLFDQGAGAAQTQFENHVEQRMNRYKDERYSGVIGKGKWLKDKVVGMPSEVNAFYQEGKKLYLASMDKTISQVANLVATKLNAAKAEIAKGKQEIQKYVAGLDPSLRQVGQEAAQNIQGKFEELEQSVDNKQNELVDSLAQKYNENLQQVDARIEQMKSENRGLVDKAMDAMGGVIKTILELKNLLMGALAKAAGAVEKIIKDPIGFLGNLITGIKQGFQNFAGNIWEHLKAGLLGWLTGAMAGAGIQMPESLDPKGIFTLVMQVLGLVYDSIRPKAVKRMGEKAVSRLESGFEMFIILKNEGIAGLWKFVQDKIGDLKSMVIDTLQMFVVERVIKAGVMWVLSLLNPASAFVRACKAIIDIIMFFIERGSQIAELVSAVMESVTAIAGGAVGGAAKAIESALAKALPVVISFMASLLGLGGISNKVQEIVQKVRQPIEKVIDWVLDQGVRFAKKIGKTIGGGKHKKNKDGKPDKRPMEQKEAENNKDGKPDKRSIEQKNADLKLALSEADALLNNDKLSAEDVRKRLPKIKSKYDMTALELVVDNKDAVKETVHVKGVINPEGVTDKEEKDADLDDKSPTELMTAAGNNWKDVKKKYLKNEKVMKRLVEFRKQEVGAIIEQVKKASGQNFKAVAAGSTDLTSDYDVTFDAGENREVEIKAVKEFNKLFRTKWKMESGTVFDTNVYTTGHMPAGVGNLELKELKKLEEELKQTRGDYKKDSKSVPPGKIKQLKTEVAKKRRKVRAEARELQKTSQAETKQQLAKGSDKTSVEIMDVMSLLKMRRFMSDAEWSKYETDMLSRFTDKAAKEETRSRLRKADTLYKQAKMKLDSKILMLEQTTEKVEQTGKGINQRVKDFKARSQAYHQQVEEIKKNNPDAEIQASNRLYETYLDDIEKTLATIKTLKAGESTPESQKKLDRLTLKLQYMRSMALIFANEAYHTGGAVEDVVLNQQMNLRLPLVTERYLESINEQTGFVMEQIGHGEYPGIAFWKSAKYVERLCLAAKKIKLKNYTAPSDATQLLRMAVELQKIKRSQEPYAEVKTDEQKSAAALEVAKKHGYASEASLKAAVLSLNQDVNTKVRSQMKNKYSK